MLQAGTKLGVYEILSPLGAGGMGEVYRARDTKLQRDVALKILPESMARDAQRMARFEREARTLASLNHPNIAAIYGLEESNSIRALVMELVEGETLAERIARPDSSVAPGFSPAHAGLKAGSTRGQGRTPPSAHEPSPQGRGWSGGAGPGEGSRGSALTVDDALPIARQIAEALECAHERGVIHRDLKPANVKIKPDGTVKVLDFGLAKVLTGQDSTTTMDMDNSPTLSAMATQAGMILGTAAYMSPEQAKGQRVDRRADIWAFGCVLYEMLAGRKPFEGETISDVLAAVIMKDPDWTAIPETTPQSIKKVVYRCLQKDQRQRLRDIGEARITIEETLSGVPEAGITPALAETLPGRPQGSPLRRALPWALAAVFAAIALIAVVFLWKSAAPAPQKSPVLAYVPPPPNTTFRDFGFAAGPVVVSPDGKRLAFSATDQKGITRLWIRPLRSKGAKAIPSTEDAAAPFWSPDGNSLGFIAGGKLKTVNLANGDVQVLADAAEANCLTRGAWSPEGTILFTPHGCFGPLYKISASGGKASPATKVGSGDVSDSHPAFLPDGHHFLYESASSKTSTIWMGSLGSGERRRVLRGASSPEFANGHLLFKRDKRVFAQPFDPETGKRSGEAVALAAAQDYSVSRNGVLAFQGGTIEGRMEWYDRSGNPLGSVEPAAVYASARISPDGKRVLADVFDPQTGSSNLWSYPAAGGPGTRLTFGPGFKYFATWSPDGKYVAYGCQPSGKWNICRKPADGSGTAQTLVTPGTGWLQEAPVMDWSPDGRYISFAKISPKTSHVGGWILPLFGGRKPFQPATVDANQYSGMFSPSGRWLAYFSYETGRPEVYVVPFPGPGGKFQISQNGGWDPLWGRKGHLYFLTMGNRLMEADLTMTGGSVQVKTLHPLFQLNLPSYADPLFDVSADGSRFLVVTSIDPNASRSIGLLLNWQAKLKGNE